MSQSLADLVADDAATGSAIGLRTWLKSSAYTRRLLLGESGDPWQGASQFLAWFAQAHGLLKPDVAVIEVGELFDSWLTRHPGVRAELAAKRKLSYPLRRLLELSGPRDLLAEVVEAVLAHLRAQVPLLLAMPSPRWWLHQASSAAGRVDVEFDADSIEDAAMYVADLARSVSSLAVGGILLEESPAELRLGPVNVALYLPVINVAKHYRWPLAMRLAGDEVLAGPALAEIDVLISAGAFPDAGKAHGVDVSAALDSGRPLPELAGKQFYFIEIPRAATPEHVLESLARLKAGGA